MPGVHDESVIRRKEGLPEDGLVFAPSAAAAPLRQPAGTWAFLVVAADVLDDGGGDREGEVVLFAGCWLPECPSASHSEGDLVVMLAVPGGESPAEDKVDVDMFLAYRDRWLRVGVWKGLDVRWPWTVATTAAAIMSLHTMMSEVELGEQNSAPFRVRPLRGHGGNGGLKDLLALGLVQAGDEFAWDRGRYGTRHTARITSDGTLMLADGRTFVNPSGALTAVGGKHQNGWLAWKRISDGRELGELRAELRRHSGVTARPQRGRSR